MKSGRELEWAYKATDFVVEDDETNIVIRIGQMNSKLDNLLAKREIENWAFITAFNPRSEQLTDEENADRHSELLAVTKAGDYEFLNGYGRGPVGDWPPEKSLLIFNVDREAAKKIGKRFGQNAIVAGRIGDFPELVWCD